MGRHKRRMLLATTGVLLLPIGLGRLPAAHACSCFPNDTIEAQTSRADVIFDGIPTERTVTQPPSFQPVTWRFDVSTVMKGTATDPQDVITADNGAMCGAHFDLGRRYRVFARREGDRLATNLCAGNRLLSDDGSVPGYRLAAADGGVFTFGSASFHGSAGGVPLAAPVVGITSTPSGRGYWLAAADGGVFTYGDAGFFGSAGGYRLHAPVVGITSTPSGRGYWLTAADGGVFAYGDARFFGSTGGTRLEAPVVGIATTGTGAGYWLLGGDGGVFTFGDAPFHGRPVYSALFPRSLSTAMSPSRPLLRATGITASHSGTGYWIVDRYGSIGGFGDTAPLAPNQPPSVNGSVGVSRTSSSPGLVVTTSEGRVTTYNASPFGDLGGRRLNGPVVGVSA